MMRATLGIALLTAAFAQTASGQSTEQATPRGGAAGRGANRARLEAQLRQNLATRARTELGLSQDQMTKLSDEEARFGPQLRALDMRENQTRRDLRSALTETPSADQDRR